MKRLILLFAILFVAVSLPALADDGEETQDWCFSPYYLFYDLDPCIAIITDGTFFSGEDNKVGGMAQLITSLEGRFYNEHPHIYVAPEIIKFTMKQTYELTYFADFSYWEVRTLNFELQKTDEDLYFGTARGWGFGLNMLMPFAKPYRFNVYLTIDENGNAEFQLSPMERTQE